MIIRHSKQLLEQLSELEKQINQLENLARSLGVEIETEHLLQIAWSRYVTKTGCAAPTLTGRSKVS